MQRREYPDRVEYLNEAGELHRIDGPAVVWVNGGKEWFFDGELHRLDGPATEWPDGDKAWWVGGKRHRVDAPAVEGADGNKVWYFEGELHRTGGPAVEVRGDKKWYVHGKLHRLDAPAIEAADGYKAWWVGGKRHRVDGPAIEWPTGDKEWWIGGKRCEEPEIIFPEEMRYTPHEDLIYREVPKSGVKYLLCSLREEHVLPHEFMTKFSKTQNLKSIRCPYCRSPVLETVFVQP